MTPEHAKGAQSVSTMTLEELEARWLELGVLATADEEAVLRSMLTKEEYVSRDLERQKERAALEVRAAQLRRK